MQIGGKLVIQFDINDKGYVVAIVTKSSQLESPPIEFCINKVIKAQKFPNAPEGAAAQERKDARLRQIQQEQAKFRKMFRQKLGLENSQGI